MATDSDKKRSQQQRLYVRCASARLRTPPGEFLSVLSMLICWFVSFFLDFFVLLPSRLRSSMVYLICLFLIVFIFLTKINKVGTVKCSYQWHGSKILVVKNCVVSTFSFQCIRHTCLTQQSSNKVLLTIVVMSRLCWNCLRGGDWLLAWCRQLERWYSGGLSDRKANVLLQGERGWYSWSFMGKAWFRPLNCFQKRPRSGKNRLGAYL